MQTDTIETLEPLEVSSQRRFGRLFAPDPGDMDYPLESRLRAMTRAELKRRQRPIRMGPVLDQGNTSRCVMYSDAAAIGAYPTAYKTPAQGIARVSIPLDGDPDLYRWACNHDEFSDNNHGEDIGTSVRAGQEYLKRTGLTSAYYWARNVEEAKDYISREGSSPLVAGTLWWQSFDRPNAKGVITEASGAVLGGHAWCVYWFDKKSGMWLAQNSWGASWGLNGRFKVPDEVFNYAVFNAGGELVSFAEVRKQ